MTESRSLHRWSGLGLAAIASIGLIAGCGGAAQVPSGGTIRIAVREYRLTPSVIDARPGAVTLQIANDGRLPHDLVVTAPDGTRTAKSTPIAPGSSVTLQATLSPGTYTIDSSLLSDKALGVTGTLHVS
jgi:hypothetical protein